MTHVKGHPRVGYWLYAPGCQGFDSPPWHNVT